MLDSAEAPHHHGRSLLTFVSDDTASDLDLVCWVRAKVAMCGDWSLSN